MSEKNATSTVRQHLKELGAHVQRIEDKLSPGVPDLNFCLNGKEAWLEGKFIKQLPKRATTLIRFGSDTRLVHQRNWLNQRLRSGGRVFVWLRVADDGWYLFHGPFDFLVDGIEVLPQRMTAKELVEEIVRCL